MSDLVTIIMDKDEIINTTKGPIRLQAGQTPEVETWMANSLVGRGYAHFPAEVEVKQLTPLPDNLASLTVAELRKLASERGVEGYNLLRKDQLLEALGPPKVTGKPGDSGKFQPIDLIPEGTELEPKFKPGYEEVED